jgi:amino acid transporter
LPLAAMAFAGLSPAGFSTGSWAVAARALGGPLLSLAVVAGGIICGVGMFNALMMSYTRLPIAMAADGLLPRVFLLRNRRGVPWISVLVCGLGWALALSLPFERLISIDLILYGTSLILEFLALIALRLREPDLPRPFRAGSFPFACLLAVGPTVLIAYALYASRSEKLGDPGTALANVSSLLFALAVALAGPPLYALTAALARRKPAASPVVP